MPPSPPSSGAQLEAQSQSHSPSPAKASKNKDPREEEEEANNDDERKQAEVAAPDDEEEEDDDDDDEEEESPDAGSSSPSSNPLDQKAKEREERFRALRARAKNAATSNLKEVYAERRRQSTDPRTLTRMQRLRSEAEFKLAKSDVLESGGDFERKRAWDWTAEESSSWDRKLAKKNRHREDVAFQDYTQAARKQYKKQLRDMGNPDLISYNKEKAKLIRDGQVYEVEGEDGEVQLVAVDRDGEFYADKDSLGFVDNKPRKEKVDKLVGELKKEEEKRSKRGRGKDGEEDVTYINDKNKQFNMKLARYYNKYTGEIRDSFERGTMI